MATPTAFFREPRGSRHEEYAEILNQRTIALRMERNMAAAEIARQLGDKENLPVSKAIFSRAIKQAALSKLRWRRPVDIAARAPHPTRYRKGRERILVTDLERSHFRQSRDLILNRKMRGELNKFDYPN